MKYIALLLLLIVTCGIIAIVSRLVIATTMQTRLAVAGLGCVMVSAQLVNQPRLTYPFESWRMYTSTSAPRVYYEFVIEWTDGNEPYPFEVLTPLSPGPLRGYSMLAPVTWRLVQSQRVCRCQRGNLQLDMLIGGLVELYEARSDRKVLGFEIRRAPVNTARQISRAQVLYDWRRR